MKDPRLFQPICFSHIPRKIAFLCVALTALLLATFNTVAQQRQTKDQADLQKQIQELKEGQIAIQKQLDEIKKLLLNSQAANQPQPPREIVIDTSGSPFKGDPNAKLTLIEFSDYQCPFCSRYVRETLPEIEKEFIATGKLKYVFRDFPIESLHQNALLASSAANCAGDQNKYWEMHDRLFFNQNALGVADMPAHAKALGLDESKFKQCIETKKHEASIRQQISESVGFGIQGTPTFFVGFTKPDDPKVRIIASISGARPYANFKEILEKVLSSQPLQNSEK